MLCLSRNVGEIVVIDDVIQVRVLSVRGDRVKLGFAAPPEIAIQRHEFWLRLQEKNDESGSTGAAG